MSVIDSYLQLARSIERGLRADLPVGEAEDLSVSIERALLSEARVGELSLASLRLIVVTISTAFAAAFPILAHLQIVQGISALAVGVLWAAWGVALLIALRRGWYRLWLRYAIPSAEALTILAMIAALTREAPGTVRPVGTLVLAATLCGYLALSGALRFSRSAAWLSTALAAVVFLIAALLAEQPAALALATSALLIVVAILGSRAQMLVRRVVSNEIGRATMTKRYEEARQAIEAREQVLKIVSHDLRNPLHTIAMTTELLLEDPSAEQRKRFVGIVRRAGERMNRLVKDLLDVAKLESGHLAIQVRSGPVSPILAEALDMLRPLAEEKTIRLDVEIPEGVPRVEADVGRVIQLLSNLVGNAIKFTPAGGRIVMRAASVGQLVQFSVSDTGPGIPPEQLPHVFGRFWQADPSDRRGIGLGLAISKAIVEAHGGRLWVESRLGNGTTFHFTLRAAPAASSGTRPHSSRPELPTRSFGGASNTEAST